MRWFVRVAAVLVGLANLAGVILWFVGGLNTLAGEGASLGEALPATLVAVVAGLVTSRIVLRTFELPGRGFSHRYWVVVASFCLGGAIEGELLGWLFTLDGTLGAGTFANIVAEGPVVLLGALAWAFVPGLVGAVMGLAVGLAEGLVLALGLIRLGGHLKIVRQETGARSIKE